MENIFIDVRILHDLIVRFKLTEFFERDFPLVDLLSEDTTENESVPKRLFLNLKLARFFNVELTVLWADFY